MVTVEDHDMDRFRNGQTLQKIVSVAYRRVQSRPLLSRRERRW